MPHHLRPILPSTLMTLLLLSGCGGDDTSTTDSDPTDKSYTRLDTYTIPDTDQQSCFDSMGATIDCTLTGQDAMYLTDAPSYVDNGDGTVTDSVTGVMWQDTPDTNGDTVIDADDKLDASDASAYCKALGLGGYDDWQLPDIKTMYSLIIFSGKDISGYEGEDTSSMTPFIDTDFFDFTYGDTDAGERLIDVQYATSTYYVTDEEMLFGVNMADGRIKAYGITDPTGEAKRFTVQCVRQHVADNDFIDNGDGTISDHSSGLMWHQYDNGEAVSWQEAIDYCEEDTTGGYDDWRLPDAKALQSIVDYSKSPDATASTAIDTDFFEATAFINEAGETDYGYYWSSTTHENYLDIGGSAVYVSFGRALGYDSTEGWHDVHGAGAQRSDPKTRSAIESSSMYTRVDTYDGTAYVHGPQGDLLRGENYARCVRIEE